MLRSKLSLLHVGVILCSAPLAGCAHLAAMDRALHSGASSQTFEYSSYARERASKSSGTSLFEALGIEVEHKPQPVPRVAKADQEQCRTEPLFLRYHLQSVYNHLKATDLNEANVGLRTEDPFIVLDIPMTVSAFRPHQAFEDRLRQLASIVRQEQGVGVFVAQYGDASVPVRWGDQDVTQQRVRQVLLSYGVEPIRIGDLDVTVEVSEPNQAFLRVKLCYQQ